jgi:DNA-binding PadR family transcriptional regulator
MIGPLAVAALGLLLERPMHPYEMVRLLLARSEDRLVKVRPGSLYHVVDRLHADGLVRTVGTERAGNRPERTTYAITAEGVDAMGDWVRQALATPTAEYPPFPLALGEAHNLPREDVVRRLHRRLVALRGQAAELAAGEDVVSGKSLPERFWLDIPYTRAVLAAEIDHLTKLAARIESGDISWPDPPATEPPGVP